MDRMIYVAMAGAKQAALRQASIAHNLANVSTAGYKADAPAFRALPVFGEGAPTRAYVAETTPYTDLSEGTIHTTGRDLDVAVMGKGFIAVQDASGREAYTRAGGLEVSVNGQLTTRDGRPVLGDAGPVAIPPGSTVTIARDGTISAQAPGEPLNAITAVGRIRLVNGPERNMVKGEDGLLRTRDGLPLAPDALVQVEQGAIEASNVNAVDALVGMISQSRQFEMQMSLIQRADEMASRATALFQRAG